MSSFYNLKAAKRGGDYDFADLKGKVVLIMNTASKCGYAAQLTPLEALYQKYKDQGLVILGFPSNSFLQELGTDEEAEKFCQVNHGVTFPTMMISDVNGSNTNAVFKYLKAKKPGLLGIQTIKWNFEKFLVDKRGSVVKRYAMTTKVADIEPDIKKLLEAE